MALDPLSAVLGIGSQLIDRLWPDPEERDKAKLAMMDMAQKGELAALDADLKRDIAQIAVNQKAAESGSLFVSGARPFIMWVCGIALAYASVLQPFLEFAAVLVMGSPPTFPEIDTSLLYPVLMGLLGLGTMRTIEKRSGVARSKL